MISALPLIIVFGAFFLLFFSFVVTAWLARRFSLVFSASLGVLFLTISELSLVYFIIHTIVLHPAEIFFEKSTDFFNDIGSTILQKLDSLT